MVSVQECAPKRDAVSLKRVEQKAGRSFQPKTKLMSCPKKRAILQDQTGLTTQRNIGWFLSLPAVRQIKNFLCLQGKMV